MKILQILPELNVGGVERGTVDLAKELVKLGHKAVVVSNGGNLTADIEAAGVIHYCLPVHSKSIWNIIRMSSKLAKIIRKEEIDIVHARSRMPAWPAFFACRKTNTAFITTCHGYYQKHFFSFVMGWGKRVIVPSNVIARHMIEDFKVPHERIRLIPRSVDLGEFKYSSPEKRIGNIFNVGIIGRLTPIKGHLDFIKAMAKVSGVNPNIKIWIVGDAPASKGAYKEQLRVLTKRLGLEACTEFLGTQKDVPSILLHLNLLVLATTTQEAFGRVIIEAQACGVPVVATAVGGVIDIIENEKTGLLVPPSHPRAMADAIIRVMNDKALAVKMAEEAYKKVREKYGIEMMVGKTLEVYKEACRDFKILIIKFSSLGDVILSTAGLRAIRDKFKKENYKISFLVGQEFKEVLLRNPNIDELLVCDFKNRDRGIGGFLKLIKVLRGKNFDMVIDLQNNRRSHILAAMTLALNRYGYDNKKLSFLLNRRIKDKKEPIGPVAHQFKLLNILGIQPPGQELELFPSPGDEQFVADFLSSQWISLNQKLVGINVGASKRWQTKLWPSKHILGLCEALNSRDIRVVVTGSGEDVKRAKELISKYPKLKIIDGCGKLSVNQLAVLIKRCAVYISADSAPLHVAAAMKTPLVALFGPTDPARHLPPAKDYVVIKKDMACSPCYKSKCANPKCMESISVEEVLGAIDKLLK
ncbi:MAG: glycosyltransferase [Candidatus Omnitrophota bacterium]